MIRISFFYIDDGLLKSNNTTNNIKTESKATTKINLKKTVKKGKNSLQLIRQTNNCIVQKVKISLCLKFAYLLTLFAFMAQIAKAQSGSNNQQLQQIQQQIKNFQLEHNRDINQSQIEKTFKRNQSSIAIDQSDAILQMYGDECYNIKNIVVNGNSIFSNKKIKKISKKYINQCISVQNI